MRKYKQLELDLKFDDQPLTYKPGEHHFSLDPLDFNSGIIPHNESSMLIANEHTPMDNNATLDPLNFNSGSSPCSERSMTIANEYTLDNSVTLVPPLVPYRGEHEFDITHESLIKYKGEQEFDSVHESSIKYKDELIESISNDGKYLDRLYSILQNINHYNLEMTYSEDELVKLRVSLLDTIASTASKLKDAINTLNGLKKY